MKGVLAIVAVVVLVALIGFWGWGVKRKIHYNLGYKALVEQTIKDMVKPEALKSPPENVKK